jgi:hypothetical protein
VPSVRLGATLATLLLAAGCASGSIGYPGRADVRAGAAPLIWIEPTNATETSPRELHVPLGTEVVWRNGSGELVFIRFTGPVEQLCGEPVGFQRTYDGASYATRFMPPFADARLCIGRPGRYDFVVSSDGRGGGSPRVGEGSGNGLSPVRYGTIVVQ